MIITIPLRVESTLNKREHWATRYRRNKRERKAAYLATPRVNLPCVVTLTRVAPRALDTDNLAGALKGVRDGVADRLGVPDNDPRIQWEYRQRQDAPRTYAVEVEIEKRS